MTQFEADSRDPGLAAERTDLSWDRSGLSLIACGAAVLRGMANTPLAHGRLAIGACILSLGVVTWALGSWRRVRVRARGPRRTTAADLLPISLGVAAVGMSALVVCLVSPG
jgi:uncharacterized membrane protein YidH (DUF202 family)